MNRVLTAIYSKTSGSDFATSIGNRFYFNKMPQNVTYPCSVYYLISDVYDHQFEEQFEDIITQFNIFSDKNESSEAGTIYENLKSLFDWSTLTITDYTHLYMRREFNHVMWIGEENLWQYSVRYRLYIQKS